MWMAILGAFTMQTSLEVKITPEVPPRRIVTDAVAEGYQAFPDICRLKNGDLLCDYYEEGERSAIRAITLRVERILKERLCRNRPSHRPSCR